MAGSSNVVNAENHVIEQLKLLRSLATRSRSKIGRNELCWCGSKKKYKNCHLDWDQKNS